MYRHPLSALEKDRISSLIKPVPSRGALSSWEMARQEIQYAAETDVPIQNACTMINQDSEHSWKLKSHT